MMNLLTTLESKRNSAVLVNGTKYAVDGNGVAHNVKEADAKKLLANTAWRVWDGRDPRKILEDDRQARREKYEKEHKAAEASNSEKDIIGKVIAEMKRQGLVVKDTSPKAAAPATPPVPPADSGANPPPPPADDQNDTPAADAGSTPDDLGGAVVDPPIPDGDEAWADPEPSYSMEWLMACAEAYEVKYPKNIGAEKLCEKIKAAMYEE